MSKLRTLKDALKKVNDGDIVMIGGFLKGGKPQHLADELNNIGAKDLTIIASDTGTTDCATYELYNSGRVKKILASYIGANPETGRQMQSGETDVELVPQGTLAERIRAGGAGLGGILTPVGVGTIVQKGKQKIEVAGVQYLLELPLKANVALIKAHMSDESGNLVIFGSSRNFNVVMASAADYVIAEVEKCVKSGDLDPNQITIPGIFVDAIVIVGAKDE